MPSLKSQWMANPRRAADSDGKSPAKEEVTGAGLAAISAKSLKS
jgi:hypothetical protein